MEFVFDVCYSEIGKNSQFGLSFDGGSELLVVTKYEAETGRDSGAMQAEWRPAAWIFLLHKSARNEAELWEIKSDANMEKSVFLKDWVMCWQH